MNQHYEENRQFAKDENFRKRMMKLTKRELIERMINMKALIDDIMEDEQ